MALTEEGKQDRHGAIDTLRQLAQDECDVAPEVFRAAGPVVDNVALDVESPICTRGWNRTVANTTLADHRLQAIARPNNDTLYAAAMVDVTQAGQQVGISDSPYASSFFFFSFF